MAANDCPLPPGSRVVTYVRDSGHADQERSVEQQRQVVEAYCRQHHLILVREFADEAQPGGSVIGRDAFQEMIALLRRLAPEPERGQREPDAPDGVLYWDLRRFARNQDDSAFFHADLRRRGYTLVSLSDNIPAGPLSRIYESMLAWKAEQDRREMSKDIKRGLQDQVAAKDAEGHYLNLCPTCPPRGFRRERYTWGYRRDGTPRTVQRWVPDKGGTWELARLAWEMRAAGATHLEIHQATRLFKTLTGYSQMFTRPIYRGDLYFGGTIYENWIEPCVSQEIWDRVQARRVPAGKHKPHQGTSDYTLSGWLKCGVCGRPVGGSTTTTPYKNKVFRYRRYNCTRRRKHTGDCPNGVTANADLVEAAVYDALADLLTPEHIQRLLAAYQPDDTLQATRHVINSIEHQLQQISDAVDRLVDAIERGGGHVGSLIQRLQEREAERRQLETELAQARRQLADRSASQLSPDAIADFCQNMRAVLQSGDVAAVRGIIGSIVTKIVISVDKRGVISYTLPPELGPAVEGEIEFFW